MSSLTLKPVTQLVSSAPALISDEGGLNLLFRSVHTVHKWWKWKQDGELLSTYYNQPALALGDLGVHYFAKDSLIFTITAVALGVVRSLWQAELARLNLVLQYKELKWHLWHLSYVPFRPDLVKPGTKTSLSKTVLKSKIIALLLLQVLYNSFCLSMHLIDLYQYFTSHDQQERAKQRFVSNGAYLHEELPKLTAYLRSHSNQLPFSQSLGLNSGYITKLDAYYQANAEVLQTVLAPLQA